jgi:MFS transporter, MHS family, proline/betaine transporter
MCRSSSMQFLSACLGNLFEHYETALFGFLSPFLASFLFPQQDPLIALILTYAMIPLGMLARPLGALVFGYIGDVHGRKQALFLSLSGMAVISGLIALIPSYSQIGILAPVFFCLGRIIQNFFSAGETMGGAIFILENYSEKHHDFLSGLYSASTIGGILLASMGVVFLSSYQMLEEGWRILYLIGCLTAFLGCLIRRCLPSTDDVSSTKSSLPHLSYSKMFWDYRQTLLLIAVCSGFSYATYSMALVLMNGFIPLISSFTKEQMINLNTGLLILDFSALPFFGWLSSKISREKLMISTALIVAISAIPLFVLLRDASFLLVLGIRVCLVLFGVAFFAPFHAWAQKLVSPAYRYSLISFGYALGSQLLGGPTAAVSLWLFKETGNVTSISWYWVALALASWGAVVKSRELVKARSTQERLA